MREPRFIVHGDKDPARWRMFSWVDGPPAVFPKDAVIRGGCIVNNRIMTEFDICLKA